MSLRRSMGPRAVVDCFVLTRSEQVGTVVVSWETWRLMGFQVVSFAWYGHTGSNVVSGAVVQLGTRTSIS